MSKKRLLQCGLALSSALTTLAVPEILLRWTGTVAGESSFQFERIATSVTEDAGRYVKHPQRFFALTAPYRGIANHPGRYATDSWAFRGRPLVPTPPHALRIGIFGDSCVYGASLDAADMLGEWLATELTQRGWNRTRVCIASFGVPGYSTVQIRALLEEVLAEHQLDYAIFYPAAWNDQSPALGPNDVELHARARQPLPWWERTATYAWLKRWTRPAPTHDYETLLDAWRKGRPLLGTRVPAAAVAEELRAIVHATRAAGARVHFIAPAHPRKTRLEHPRVMEDAASVRRVAAELNVPLLDAAALFAAHPQGDETYFSDFVHPSPDGMQAIAAALAPILSADFATRDQTQIQDLGVWSLQIEARERSCFGGEWLRLRFNRRQPMTEPIALVCAGAPLLELKYRNEDQSFEGLLMANRPGRYDLVLQSNEGCQLFSEVIELVGPRIELVKGAPCKLRLHSRPFDIAEVMISTRRLGAPRWSPRGALRIDPEAALDIKLPLRAGADGIAELAFDPPAFGTHQAFYLQAEVFALDADQTTLASRWTEVVEWTAPPR